MRRCGGMSSATVPSSVPPQRCRHHGRWQWSWTRCECKVWKGTWWAPMVWWRQSDAGWWFQTCFKHVFVGGGLPATSISTRPTQDVDPLAPKKMGGWYIPQMSWWSRKSPGLLEDGSSPTPGRMATCCPHSQDAAAWAASGCHHLQHGAGRLRSCDLLGRCSELCRGDESTSGQRRWPHGFAYNILLMSIKGLGWQFGLHRKSSGHSFWFIYNHLFWVLATSPFLLTNLLQSLKTTPSLCNPSSCLA